MKDFIENKQPSDESLARLLKLAGPRAEPSSQIRDEVYDGVHAHWQARNKRSGFLRRLVPAIAASLIAVLVVLLWPTAKQDAVFAGTVGQFDRGGLEYRLDGVWHAVQTGEILPGEAVVRTGSKTRAGVILINGVSVRLDYDTQMRFESPNRLALNYGRLYVDTADQRIETGLEIVTANGVVRDIGTQFEVLADASLTRVRVRDGEIILVTTAEEYHAIRGEQLSLLADGRIARSAFASRDVAWNWAYDVAPKFDTDGRLVTDLIDWVVRETGREAKYADARIRNAAASTRISGSVTGRTPEETLDLALATTRFKYHLDEFVLVIEKHH